MTSAPEFECADCGAAFSLPERVLERYPGWTPRQCLPCRDRVRPPRDAAPAPPTRSKGRSSGRRGRSATASRVLTPEQVLARYEDGPKTGVFTDGGASPNPGRGGWGLVEVVEDEIVREACGGELETTNNRMELTALIRAFTELPLDSRATVFSDSQLCVNTINDWAVRWERAGWKRRSGPIQNLDLVQELHALARARPNVTLEWVPAHRGWRWNEYADALATLGRRGEVR